MLQRHTLENKISDINSFLLKEHNIDIRCGCCMDFAFALGELVNKVKSFKIYCSYANDYGELLSHAGRTSHAGLIWNNLIWDADGSTPLKERKSLLCRFDPIFYIYFNWQLRHFYDRKRVGIIKSAIKKVLDLKEENICFDFEPDNIRYSILNNPMHNYFDRSDFVLELSDFYEFNQWNCYAYQDQDYIIFYELWNKGCLAGLEHKYGNSSKDTILKHLPDRMKKIGEALNIKFHSFHYDNHFEFEGLDTEGFYRLSKISYLKYF